MRSASESVIRLTSSVVRAPVTLRILAPPSVKRGIFRKIQGLGATSGSTRLRPSGRLIITCWSLVRGRGLKRSASARRRQREQQHAGDRQSPVGDIDPASSVFLSFVPLFGACSTAVSGPPTKNDFAGVPLRLRPILSTEIRVGGGQRARSVEPTLAGTTAMREQLPVAMVTVSSLQRRRIHPIRPCHQSRLTRSYHPFRRNRCSKIRRCNLR